MAYNIGENRTALPADALGVIAERAAILAVSQNFKFARVFRDQATAALFGIIFGGASQAGASETQDDDTDNSSRIGV